MKIEKENEEYKISMTQDDIENLCLGFSDAHDLYDESDYEIPETMQKFWDLLSPFLEM
jgi:hypothetical protein